MKTLREKIEVMEWYENGGKIERNEWGKSLWLSCDNPNWDWHNYQYRIKKEPRVVYLTEKPNGDFIGQLSGAVKIEGETKRSLSIGEKYVRFVEDIDNS